MNAKKKKKSLQNWNVPHFHEFARSRNPLNGFSFSPNPIHFPMECFAQIGNYRKNKKIYFFILFLFSISCRSVFFFFSCWRRCSACRFQYHFDGCRVYSNKSVIIIFLSQIFVKFS